MTDEIMQELWAIKDAISKEADYDLDKLCRQLKQRQAKGWKPQEPPSTKAMKRMSSSLGD